jgi:hypothetical protein
MQLAANAKHTATEVEPVIACHLHQDLVVVLDLRHIAKAALIIVAHQQELIDPM